MRRARGRNGGALPGLTGGMVPPAGRASMENAMIPRIFGAIVLSVAVAGPVMATEYDGVYKPDLPFAAGWDEAMTLASGNGLKIEGDSLKGMGASCTIANPVNVRAMDATLYDTTCGDQDAGRVMLMKTAAGVLVIRNGLAVEWLRSR